MPYVRGGTLRERIGEFKSQGRQFELSTISSYITQIADALSYAHSLGVIHRDIKPGNLLFHQDGRLLLSDFGIVRLIAMPSLTTAGSFLGTAEYASPEQVSAAELDPRSDIYSLGIILFELLTMHVPFTGPNPFAVMSKQLSEPVPSLRNIRPDLSPSIEFVVKKALAKNPKDRYQHAMEMADDLNAAISPALAVAAGMRLPGDANHDDLTVSDRSWQAPVAQASIAPAGYAGAVLPPTNPAGPAALSPVAMPWQQEGGPWQWPPQTPGAQMYAPAQPEPQPIPATVTYHQGRRLFFYGVAIITVPVELLIFILLNTPAKAGGASPAILGVLLGTGINLLALAAMSFVAVTGNQPIRKNFYRSLFVAILSPLLGGFFIAFGAANNGNDLNVPIVAFLILLLSNIYAIRQLSQVDVARQQYERAPILWRSALVGALTGLLPSMIILVILLATPLSIAFGSSLLLRMFVVLLIVFIGAPTPGAMMAVWLSEKMTFPVLLRSSAIAGMFMFVGAYLLVSLWSLLPSSYVPFYAHFRPPLLAFLVTLALLALVGVLRAMLDAYVYHRILLKRKSAN
jgi:hypothetical protein